MSLNLVHWGCPTTKNMAHIKVLQISISGSDRQCGFFGSAANPKIIAFLGNGQKQRWVCSE